MSGLNKTDKADAVLGIESPLVEAEVAIGLAQGFLEQHPDAAQPEIIYLANRVEKHLEELRVKLNVAIKSGGAQ
jgi:hypothetical protein